MDITPIAPLVEKLSEALDKCGLYTMDMTLMGKENEGEDRDLRAIMAEDDAPFVLIGTFKLGRKIAFSDRVLHPEKYDDDKIFREMMPTREDLLADKLRAGFEKAAGDPEAICALFDDDEDDDEDE